MEINAKITSLPTLRDQAEFKSELDCWETIDRVMSESVFNHHFDRIMLNALNNKISLQVGDCSYGIQTIIYRGVEWSLELSNELSKSEIDLKTPKLTLDVINRISEYCKDDISALVSRVIKMTDDIPIIRKARQ